MNTPDVLSHEEGYEKWRSLKDSHELEIELICLNASFDSVENVKNKLKGYQDLSKTLESISVLKESEAHEEDVPYYEMSLFSNMKNIKALISKIEDLGIAIDLIHTKDGEYYLESFKEEFY